MNAAQPDSQCTPAEITRRSGSSFSMSFAFLTPERRRGIAAIYAYCRAVDDAVDEAPDVAHGRAELQFWRDELEAALGAIDREPLTETGREVATTVRRFGVDPRNLRAVAEGCAMDLDGVHNADLRALEHYCSLVASAVGRACLPVFGVAEAVAGRYADHLGKALQLTNILRDLRSDARIGRCYVPHDMLRANGVDVAWLSGDGPAEAYRDDGPCHQLVRELVQVARAHFAAARDALPQAPEARRCLLAPEIMGAVYAVVLDKVVARRGRIDRPERLRVSRPRKLALALRIWWRMRRGSR